MYLYYSYRVKNLSGLLNQWARKVNYVWNFCNDRQKDALRYKRKWLTGYDLQKLTSGSSKELGLHSQSIKAICEKYFLSRSQSRKPCLRYRSKKSLGWIPLSGLHIKRDINSFIFHSKKFVIFNSRPLPDGDIKDGTNFSQDAKGNWYLNIVIEVAEAQPREIKSGIGIDLGLKEFAKLSNGEAIENPRHYRNLEEKLAKAQRSKKKRLARNIHAKIKNQRSDFLHKLSYDLVNRFDYIAVGNVNSSGLAKTNLAKSIYDVGWSSFRVKLAYKAIRHGAWYEEVDEKFSTQDCSACGSRSGPKGLKDLGIREWTCTECGTSHDRDVNAAKNILRRGRATLGVGAVANTCTETPRPSF